MRELETSLKQFGEFILKGAAREREGGAVLRALGAPVPHAAGVQRAAGGRPNVGLTYARSFVASGKRNGIHVTVSGRAFDRRRSA